MPVSITTRAAKGSKLTTVEVDANFTGLKTAIDSVADAATETTIADTSIGKVMLDIAGVPKKISIDNLVAAISTPVSGLADAAALSGSDIITISQDGGSTEVRTTLAALATFLGTAPVAVTGFTLTGPTSGVSGVASSNFTIGVTGGSTLTGTVTVTPSDAGGGGTFTPTSRALSTSALSATFTYTPASTGAKTISITNNGGLTNPSNITYTVSAAATVSGAPTGVTATTGNTTATVTFTAPASDGGSAITGYTVTSSPAGGTDANAGTTGLSHSITGLTNGTAYTFTVTATNAIGTGAASSASSAVTPSAGATAPAQVTGLTLGTATSTTQPLTWTAPNNGGSAITDYAVQWSPAGAGTWATFADGTGTTTSATVTGLTASTSYDYRVAAVNAIGTGTNSATSTGSTASAGTVYTITGYGGAPFRTTQDATSLPTGGGYKYAVGGNGPVLGGAGQYVSVAPATSDNKCEFGWGTSATVPPASITNNGTYGNNGLASYSHNGTAYPVGNIYLWLNPASGATQTWYYWAKPTGGSAQLLSTVVISNI